MGGGGTWLPGFSLSCRWISHQCPACAGCGVALCAQQQGQAVALVPWAFPVGLLHSLFPFLGAPCSQLSAAWSLWHSHLVGSGADPHPRGRHCLPRWLWWAVASRDLSPSTVRLFSSCLSRVAGRGLQPITSTSPSISGKSAGLEIIPGLPLRPDPALLSHTLSPSPHSRKVSQAPLLVKAGVMALLWVTNVG